jgi:uncharacterized protein
MAVSGIHLFTLRNSAIAAAAAWALLAAVPASADVKAGVDAWSVGDYARAVQEWQEPARAGDADAIFNLAQAYRLGRGVDANTVRAKELYAEAANLGHIKAADNYGLMLFQQGNAAAAMPMIKAAAERGDPRAQYVLGLAHFNADHAPRDWVRAYALMTLSHSSGLPQAQGALAQMDQYIPIAQRQQAQSLARQIEEEATRQRATEMAAADLSTRPAPVAVPAAAVVSPAPLPAAVAVTAPTRTPQSVTPPVATPAPVPVAAPAAAAARSVAPATPARTGGSWRVQLGAFGVAGNADRLWGQLSSNPALAGTRKVLVPGGNVTRLHAVGFATKADAENACARLKTQGQACIVAGNS